MLGPYDQQRGVRRCGQFQGWAGRVTLLLGAFLCFAEGAHAQVTNGDFSGGNTGFSSGYTYTTADAPTFTAGNYTIGTNPSTYNGGWVSLSAPSGSGNMMIVNGSTTSGTTVWSETVNVTPGITYTFTVDAAEIYSFSNGTPDPSPASLNFYVGDTLLGTLPVDANTPGTWQTFSDTYSSGADTSETLTITDTDDQFQGNDFALDDISDTSTPEPASIFLFGSGLLGIAGFWRRRFAARDV